MLGPVERVIFRAHQTPLSHVDRGIAYDFVLLVAFLASWLQQRLGGALSEMMALMNMVYQGTVSGPILWNLFFEDTRYVMGATFFRKMCMLMF